MSSIVRLDYGQNQKGDTEYLLHKLRQVCTRIIHGPSIHQSGTKFGREGKFLGNWGYYNREQHAVIPASEAVRQTELSEMTNPLQKIRKQDCRVMKVTV